ncbi:RHS repeat-associated core domain-containing protein [Edaphocola flava]|uniref:RHS repeat-associated core domain-containing protein n=1 Tax=Edaphocola flava TaxID=2499629 RepID=UPI00100A9896|nr:RHS repeat-associated core domain-containing protein [Edaphocola flava]
MDFHNRQYDPQLGRFMGIDPMADAAGQQGLSPYHAMACNPSTMTDPLGLFATGPAHEGMYSRKPGLAAVPLYYVLLCTPLSKILDMMYGSVFYSADQKMEEVLAGFYSDMAAHDAMIAKRYNAILEMVWQDAIAETAGLTAGVKYDVSKGGKINYSQDGMDPAERAGNENKAPEKTAWGLDKDNILDIEELRNWRLRGNGAPIEIDASKLNIGEIDLSKYEDGKSYSLFLFGNFFFGNGGFYEARIIGGVTATYRAKMGGFELEPNLHTFSNIGVEYGHPWKGTQVIRNLNTWIGGLIDGAGTDFMIHFRGIARPTAPNLPEYWEYERFKSPGNW